jgi:hypothetical protein
MPDNTFTIGATVNVAELQAGMNAGAEAVQESLDKMLVAFSEASPAAARAVAKISDDTRAAAVNVDEGWQRMARATLVYNAALKEVSAASYLARKAGEDDAAAMNLLAAAKQKAAMASIELKAAEAAQAEAAEEAAAAEAAAAARAAAEAEISSNVIVAAFQRSAIAIRETAASIALSTEESGLSIEAMSGALEGMTGALVGGALIGGMFGHMAGEAAEFSLQMRNLGAITGISATTLAGLHDVVKEMGGDFDSVSVGLGKMLKAQQDAVDGSQKQVRGFDMIGIKVNELKSLTPEELFYRIADGMEHASSTAVKNAAASDIFGKGYRGLLAVFEALGPALRDHVEEEAKVSGVTEKSIADAAKYKEVVEELSVAWRSFATATIPVLMGSFAEIGAALEAFGSIGINALNIIGAAVMSLLEGLKGVGIVIKDVVTGNFSAIAGDARTAAKTVGDEWRGVGADIEKDWKRISAAVAHPLAGLGDIPQIPKRPGEDLPGAADTGKDKRLEEWRAELQTKKDAEDGFHELSKAEEAKFWESKLALAKGNAKLYAEVYHQMREDERAAQKDSLKDEENIVKERLAATKQGSMERLAILQEEVAHLKAIGADETQFYKSMELELIAATRASAEQQAKDAVESEQKKIDATRKASEDRVAAERAVLADLKAMGLEKTAVYVEQEKKITEAEKAAAEEHKKLQTLDASESAIAAKAKLSEQRAAIQQEFDLHQINNKQRIAALESVENQEYAIEKDALQKKLALMLQDNSVTESQVKEQQNKIESLTREHNSKIEALNTQFVKDGMQKFDQLYKSISSGFENSINHFIETGRGFNKSMQQLWNSMVMDFVKMLEDMVAKWIEKHVVLAAINAVFHTQQAAQEAASAAAKVAATLPANVMVAQSDAAVAAAAAFASAMQSVPFPANMGVAPAAAAAALAEGEVFTAMASASGGAFLDKDTPLFAHAQEMVLPAPLSMGFKDIIGRMNSQIGGEPIVNDDHSTTFGDLNYSPTYNHPASPQQDPRVITRMVQRRLAKQTGGAIRR